MIISERLFKLLKSCSDIRGRLVHKKLEDIISDIALSEEIDNTHYSPKALYIIVRHSDSVEFDPPRCKICGALLTSDQIERGKKFCSETCSKQSVIIESKKTKLARYGDANYVNTTQRRKTCIEKYGSTEWVGSEEFSRNRKKYFANSVNRGRSGLKNSPDWKEKCIATSMKKYGVPWAMQSAEVREKSRLAVQEKYGVDNASKAESIREKIKTHRRSKYYDTFVKLLKEKHISFLGDRESYASGSELKFHCDDCDNTWVTPFAGVQQIYCPHCQNHPYSIEEKDFVEEIRKFYNGAIEENVRGLIGGRFEIDIYFPDKQVGVEYNGNYWHSDIKRDRLYHQAKALAAREHGIRLIQIFEWELCTKRRKVLNLILDALGVSSRRIMARNCTMKPIDSKDYEDFLTEYHFNGAVKSQKRFGLFCGGEMIAVCGFGLSRFKKGEWELHRYCVKHGVKCVGGLSKMIAHSGVEDFVTFVDLTHFSGVGYERVGMEQIAVTPPNYVYVNHNSSEVISRYQAQKHRLRDLLKKFDPSLTEYDNMCLNGYMRIYDAGNLKFGFSKKLKSD